MPVPPRTVHKNALHIPGRSAQNQPLQQELVSDNDHWDSDDWQVWNTSAADCSEVLFLFQMYCGFPALPVSGEVPVLPELCSAAENTPSMAWTAILTASLAYITILATSLVNRAQLTASLAALFRQYQLGAVPAAPLWHQITNVLTNTTSVLLALPPKTHR